MFSFESDRLYYRYSKENMEGGVEIGSLVISVE